MKPESSRDEISKKHLRGIIDIIQENIDKLLNDMSNPQIRELTEALFEVWDEYQSLLDYTNRDRHPTLSFFINNILTRYIIDLEYSATLCMAEAVSCISRALIEYWEQAIVLDYHEMFRRWPPERKIRWLLGIALNDKENTEISVFKEKYVNMLRDLLNDKIFRKIKQIYHELSDNIHGVLQSKRILEARLEHLMVVSCAEAIFDINIIIKNIKIIINLFRVTIDIIEYLK
ncbi:MAG: hypothetical protein F7C38_08290 [Desulfurococcales archaeon]|nr:hypothetical protein [Desulfurococcales archaeon]